MKYIDADKIRTEIKRLKAENNCGTDEFIAAKDIAYDKVFDFLEILEEPVSDDLEEAAEEYATTHLRNNEFPTVDSAFRAGAEWQKAKILKDNPIIMPVEDFQALIDSHAKRVEADYKEKMLKGAVEGYVKYYEDSGGILMAEAQVGCPYHNGDKVKIIIVKEEE